MKKAKVLVFTDWFLPGYRAGGPVTSMANLTAHLKDEAEFYIITRDTDYCEEKPYENIVSGEWVKVADNTNVYYVSKHHLTAGHIREAITGTPQA